MLELPTLRHVFEGPGALLSELPLVGHSRFQRAGPLGAHVHVDAFEICLILSGSVDWWAGDELHEVRGGELYVTRPGEEHGGVDATMNPCELYWFHLVFPDRTPLPGLSARNSDLLRQRFGGLRLRSFASSESTRRACDRLIAEHARPDDLSVAGARSALHALMIGALRDHDAACQRRDTRSQAVRDAMTFLSEHLAEPLRIEHAARAVGMSVGRLHAKFLAETGLTPADWRLRQRVRRAKTMLRSGDRSVMDIALDLGFSSSQYFATAFKRVTGVAPGDYRRSHAIHS